MDKNILNELLKDVDLGTVLSTTEQPAWKLYEFPILEKDGSCYVLGEVTPPAWFSGLLKKCHELADHLTENQGLLRSRDEEHFKDLLQAIRDFAWAKLELSLPQEFIVGRSKMCMVAAKETDKKIIGSLNYDEDKDRILVQALIQNKPDMGQLGELLQKLFN